ncbi:MAG: hypothetical protein ACRD3L_09945 [Terriglobales bacterium]
MRVLKLMLAGGFVLSVVSVFVRGRAASGGLETLLSILSAAIFGGVFYGIHTRALVMWKLGFFGIAVGAASFFIRGLSLVRSDSATATNARIESAFLVVATTVVTVYWSFWWSRQKRYFSKPSE